MTKPLSHERCSELLPGFIEGALSGEDALSVEEHLSSCEQCSAEKRGVAALLSGEADGLTATERAALERGVMAGISGDAPGATVVPLEPRRSVGMRLAGALGAAATVAVIATLAYFGAGSGSDEAGMTAGGTTEVQDEGPDAAGERSSEKPNNKTRREALASKADVESDSAAGTTGAGGAGGGGAPAPTFRVEGRLSASGLQKRGESSLESVRSAAYFSSNDASGARTLLEQLVDAADRAAGPEIANQVEECATQVLETSDPTVPTFGMIGNLRGDDVLVLGFAWTRARSGPLDRYMVWAWERGSCDVAVDFVEGKIETAN